MTNKQYSTVWTAIGTFVSLYVISSWFGIHSIGGFDIPFKSTDKVPAAILGVFAASIGTLILASVAVRYSSTRSAISWKQRFPRPVGFVESPSAGSKDEGLIQMISLILFLAIPLASIVHFNYSLLKNAKVFEEVSVDGSSRGYQEVGGYFFGFRSSDDWKFSFFDDRYRIGESASDFITWAPVVQPVLILLLSLGAFYSVFVVFKSASGTQDNSP